LIYVINRLIIT